MKKSLLLISLALFACGADAQWPYTSYDDDEYYRQEAVRIQMQEQVRRRQQEYRYRVEREEAELRAEQRHQELLQAIREREK